MKRIDAGVGGPIGLCLWWAGMRENPRHCLTFDHWKRDSIEPTRPRRAHAGGASRAPAPSPDVVMAETTHEVL